MNRMPARCSAVLAVVASIALPGCSSEEPAAVKQKAPTTVTVVTTVVQSESAEMGATASTTPESAEPTDSSTPTSTSPGSPQLGDLVTVADWDVKVTNVVLDASQLIRRANSFNDRPKGQYVLVTYEATYTGHDRTADVSDLSWSLTTSDSQIHDPASEVTPADDQEWPTEARSGGTVRGQVVWDVKNDSVKGGILTVEGYTKDFDEVYADFPLDSLS
jgi:hypothetical protein